MTDKLRELLGSRQAWIALALAAVLVTLRWVVSAYILGILTIAYYFGVFAMTWDLLFGFANEVNFGPTFLIGCGAYAAGLLNAHEAPIWACLIAGGAAALLGGVVLAVPALRLSGPYFGLATLVAVLLLQQFIVIFASTTGGEIGLTMNDILSTEPVTNYWYALGFMTASGLVLFTLSRSPVGLILQASGQDRIGASALGFNIVKHKLAAFCISAVFSGLAGAMLVFYLGTASVGTVVDVAVGVQVIIAAVLGGRRTILGAAIGSIFLILAGEALRPLGQLSTFVVSGIALLVILFFADGLMGLLLRRRGDT
ncbi:MAG: branched-chain amino acid ABC transporter permease [Steroidobacteraceae bacterium]